MIVVGIDRDAVRIWSSSACCISNALICFGINDSHHCRGKHVARREIVSVVAGVVPNLVHPAYIGDGNAVLGRSWRHRADDVSARRVRDYVLAGGKRFTIVIRTPHYGGAVPRAMGDAPVGMQFGVTMLSTTTGPQETPPGQLVSVSLGSITSIDPMLMLPTEFPLLSSRNPELGIPYHPTQPGRSYRPSTSAARGGLATRSTPSFGSRMGP